MSKELSPGDSPVVDVYEKLRRQQSDGQLPAKWSLGDILNSSETKDVSSKQDNDKDKDEIRQYCQLKEQISQMKNRLACI